MKEGKTLSHGVAEPDYRDLDYDDLVERIGYDFGLSRRSFVQVLGAGLLIVAAIPAAAQEGGGRRGGGGLRGAGAANVGARIHLGKDGSITVLVGKVEGGQGARAELTVAAAEEMRVAADRVQLLMADTALVPNDGITAGSGSTPYTVPEVRRGAAAAREILVSYAAKQWEAEPGKIQVADGKASQPGDKRSLSYADLAADENVTKSLAEPVPRDIALAAVTDWKVLGHAMLRPNARDILTGAHKYPSDIARPGMLYGKVLRAPAYGAKLSAIDLAPAKAMKDVVVVKDDSFVGVAGPNTSSAEEALDALTKAAKWERSPHPSSKELFDYLRQHAESGVPSNPFADELASAKKTVRASYHVSYIQHAPLEPRAAVAEWDGDKLTVWTGTQNPFGVRSELMRAFHLAEDHVRVIVPDFGAAYGGKHTGEAAVEAARLAKAAGKPVSLRWTRKEEFTWAYFRPAALIETEAALNGDGKIASWHFININSGPNAVDTPYAVGKRNCRYVPSQPPLRHGSYRALAATANNFARESLMDELAVAAGADPLDFRLDHLENERLRAVLDAAANRFGWKLRVKKKSPSIGVGLACGTEKGSFVAACAEIEIRDREIKVRRVCEAFECGAILNPANLLSQVQGAIVMGIGAALREAMEFENGEILNASFKRYEPPRFDDVPDIDVQLLNRGDLTSAGAGETPIIAIAPAIANAVFHAIGKRIRSMPIQLPEPGVTAAAGG